MKKTFMTIALAAATVPFTFGAQAPATNPPANQNTKVERKTKVKAKRTKKHSKHHNKSAAPATTANPTK